MSYTVPTGTLSHSTPTYAIWLVLQRREDKGPAEKSGTAVRGRLLVVVTAGQQHLYAASLFFA